MYGCSFGSGVYVGSTSVNELQAGKPQSWSVPFFTRTKTEWYWMQSCFDLVHDKYIVGWPQHTLKSSVHMPTDAAHTPAYETSYVSRGTHASSIRTFFSKRSNTKQKGSRTKQKGSKTNPKKTRTPVDYEPSYVCRCTHAGDIRRIFCQVSCRPMCDTFCLFEFVVSSGFMCDACFCLSELL